MTKTSTLTITHPTYGTLNILYFDNGLKQDWDRQLKDIQIPRKTDEDGKPLTWIIDLLRVKHMVTVTGILEDESGNSMWTKRNKLQQIVSDDNPISIAWDTEDTYQPYACSIQKASIAERTGSMGDSADTSFFEVTIAFTIGTNK